MAGPGGARSGIPRQGRRGPARPGAAWPTRRGWARRGGHGQASQVRVRHGAAGLGGRGTVVLVWKVRLRKSRQGWLGSATQCWVRQCPLGAARLGGRGVAGLRPGIIVRRGQARRAWRGRPGLGGSTRCRGARQARLGEERMYGPAGQGEAGEACLGRAFLATPGWARRARCGRARCGSGGGVSLGLAGKETRGDGRLVWRGRQGLARAGMDGDDGEVRHGRLGRAFRAGPGTARFGGKAWQGRDCFAGPGRPGTDQPGLEGLGMAKRGRHNRINPAPWRV